MPEVLFWGLVAGTGLAAFALAFSRKLLRAGTALFAVLVGVAALFPFVGADFLTAAQLITYVGGVLVVVLFGILLTGRFSPLQTQPTSPLHNLLPGLLAAGGLLAGLLWVFEPILGHLSEVPAGGKSTLRPMGSLNLTDYLLPFEVVSLILLVALVAAAYLVRRPAAKGRAIPTPTERP